jgi:very-short-patch-repair endonuclease
MNDPGHNRKALKHLRRELRRHQTPAETRLWSRLRGRRFYDLKFVRQYSVGNYIIDFYCHEARLGIELDGGRHNTVPAEAKDAKRTRYLTACGIRVLRFWNYDIFKNLEEVLGQIIAAAGPHITAMQDPSGLRPPPLTGEEERS